MPALATLVINDGQATPVAHNFLPQKIEGGIATFADRSSGLSIGYPRVSIKVDEANPRRPTNKCTVKIVVPVLAVTAPTTMTGIQPLPTLAHNAVFEGTFVTHQSCSSAVKDDLWAYTKNLFASTTILMPSVKNAETYY